MEQLNEILNSGTETILTAYFLKILFDVAIAIVIGIPLLFAWCWFMRKNIWKNEQPRNSK